MTEQAWQAKVESLATLYSWRWFHAPDNRPIRAASGRTYLQNVNPGFPDLVLVRGQRTLFIELKSATGRLSPDQKAWLRDLATAGQEVAVWRPDDTDRIIRVLGPKNERLDSAALQVALG